MAVDQKKTKTRKTAEEIALERLGVAERMVKKLTERKTKAESELATVTADLAEATRRRDFLQNDPALVVDVEVLDHAPVDPCPECAAGKHGNCTHEVPVGDVWDTDEMAPCPCEERDHKDAPA